MKHPSIPRLCLLLAVLLVALPLAADDQRTTIRFSGDSSRTVEREGMRTVVLTGNAWIDTGTTRISAREITLSGENYRHATSVDNVTVVDTEQQITITTSMLTYDRTTSTAECSGWTELEDREGGLTARGGYLKNSGEDGITIIQISARILKDTDEGQMLCRADSIRYDSEEQTLELTGNAYVFWNDDEYRAARITIDLETNDIELEGDVSGTIYD